MLSFSVDDGRKRVMAIVAGILVARHLKTADDLFALEGLGIVSCTLCRSHCAQKSAEGRVSAQLLTRISTATEGYSAAVICALEKTNSAR